MASIFPASCFGVMVGVWKRYYTTQAKPPESLAIPHPATPGKQACLPDCTSRLYYADCLPCDVNRHEPTSRPCPRPAEWILVLAPIAFRIATTRRPEGASTRQAAQKRRGILGNDPTVILSSASRNAEAAHLQKPFPRPIDPFSAPVIEGFIRTVLQTRSGLHSALSDQRIHSRRTCPGSKRWARDPN